MSEHKIKIAVSDTGGNQLDPNDTGVLHVLVDFLKQHFNAELVPFEDADYLLYGDFGFRHMKFKGIKIFYTGENHKANFHATDYALTHEFEESKRHLRLPYYVHYALAAYTYQYAEVSSRPMMTREDLHAQKKLFCNFIYRNHVCKARNRIFHELSKYKRVDAGGPLFNNIGHKVENKVEFQRDYKFSIAYENEKSHGYSTEKLFDALMARTVPIYWGNPDVELDDFNPDAYIKAADFKTTKELIDYIQKVDEDDELCLKYLNASALKESCFYLDEDRIVAWLSQIFIENKQQRSRWDRFYYRWQQVFGRDVFAQLRRFNRYVKRSLKR